MLICACWLSEMVITTTFPVYVYESFFFASYVPLFRLYKERLSQVDIKLQEVMAGCAQEYLEPLANLQENMQIRTKVAGRSM